MALPLLNAVTYELTLPSTGEKITYRPYLVKEEKTLMMAAESKNYSNIYKATVDTINACVLEPKNFDIRKHRSYDLEYLFVHLRIHSVGSKQNIKGECQSCKKEIESTISFESISFKGDPKKYISDKIEISPGICFELMYPPVKDISGLLSKEKLTIEDQLNIIDLAISKVYLGDTEVFNYREESKEERTEKILDRLNGTQLQMISEFLNSIYSYVPYKYICTHCGHKGESEVQGLQNFFL